MLLWIPHANVPEDAAHWQRLQQMQAKACEYQPMPANAMTTNSVNLHLITEMRKAIRIDQCDFSLFRLPRQKANGSGVCVCRLWLSISITN